MKRGSNLFGAVALGLGVVLFIITVRKAGVDEIVSRASALGYGFALVVATSGLRVAVRALAWLICLPKMNRQIGFLALFNARLIGDAAGHLTFAGPLLSEPARLSALKNRLSLTTTVHSLAIETITYALSSCVMVFLGALVLLGSFAQNPEMKLASVLALLSMAVVIGLTSLVVIRRWAILSALGEWARRGLHLVGFSRRWKRQVGHLRTFENQVFQFHRARNRDFLLVIGCEAVFHLLGVVETWLTLDLLGFTPTLISAFVLEATNRAVNMVFSFVPARVGVDEVSTGLLAEALGLGATAGVAVAIVRKARVLVWTAVGLAVFAIKR